MIALAQVLALFVVMAWTLAGTAILFLKAIRRDVPDAVRHVFHELRPLFLPAVVILPVTHAMLGTTSAWTWVNLAMNVWNWWGLRNIDDDDDRWQRRRKRLAEKVSVVGGRLAVVPAGAR